MGGYGLFRILAVAGCAVALSACEIVDTGATRIGGNSCTANGATPGTPEYRDCRARNASEPRTNSRTPGGGIN
jgi:hypothetical protein